MVYCKFELNLEMNLLIYCQDVSFIDSSFGTSHMPQLSLKGAVVIFKGARIITAILTVDYMAT